MINPTHPVPATFPSTSPLVMMRNIGIVLIGSLVVALCARIAIPLSFTPVPLTLQPFAVLALGMILSPRLGAMTLATYLAEGAIGLPVFSPIAAGATGFQHLLGPTGGYLVAYPIAVYAIASLWRSSTRTLRWALLSTLVGDVIILGVGAVWLSTLTRASVNAVLSQAIIPFLPGDAIKVAVAAVLGFEWYRMRRQPTHPQR